MDAQPDISWQRVVVEAVVIVTSILLAFSIDAAWDGRQDRLLEREVLSALEQVMLDTQDEVNRVLQAEEAAIRVFDSFIESTPEELLALSQDSAVAIFTPLAGQATLSPLHEVVLGQVDQLRDPDLRRAMGTWSSGVADIVDLAPNLMANVRAVRMSMGPRALIHRYGPAGADGDSASEVLAELRGDDAFITSLVTARASRNANRGKVVNLGDVTNELLAKLRERLSGGAF